MTPAWYLTWRYWLAGALVLWLVWGVECLRKGDLMWPWPVVPLVVWAVVIVLAQRSEARIGSSP